MRGVRVGMICLACNRYTSVAGKDRESWVCDHCGRSPCAPQRDKVSAFNAIYSDKPTLSRTLDKVTRTY